jgi:hypothetical protein
MFRMRVREESFLVMLYRYSGSNFDDFIFNNFLCSNFRFIWISWVLRRSGWSENWVWVVVFFLIYFLVGF